MADVRGPGWRWNPRASEVRSITVEYRMARGFESKDVEFQQAEAERTRVLRSPLTAADRQAADRRRTLELSLTRMQADLHTATASAHRRTIEHAISALSAALAGALDDVLDGATAGAFKTTPADRLSGRIPQ